MKKITLIIIIIVLIFGLWIAYDKFFSASNSPSNNENIYSPTVITTVGNPQLETAITDFLQTKKDFAWQTVNGGRNFCVIDNLGNKEDLFPLYLWVRCGEFILKQGQVVESSGMSAPIKLNYPNELSFYDPAKFSYQIPRDGSLYGQDVRTIFPEGIQAKVSRYDSHALSEKLFQNAKLKLD